MKQQGLSASTKRQSSKEGASTHNEGLSISQASQLLTEFGPNELPARTETKLLELFLSQLKSFLVWLLVAASIISFLIGDRLDGILILLIVVLNTSLGFWQEYKASKELAALKKLEVSVSRVIRQGKELLLESKFLVPGDLVIIEAGTLIPSDGMLTESFNLSINESSLTGEAMPVVKSTDPQDCQIYFGTSVTSGRGKFKVSSTGVNTRFGKIALTLSNVVEEPTPLEVTLQKLARNLSIVAIIASICLLAIRLLQGFALDEVFLTSVALLVASVPEGLPAIVTIILAIGVSRMYKAKSLVRKLSSIESLGAATVICTDKTGTITQNKMRLKTTYPEKPTLELVKASVICNSANLSLEEDNNLSILGDTTEGALLLWALDTYQMSPEKVRSSGSLLVEAPFDTKTRKMSVIWKEDKLTTLYLKGAPEVILPLCKLNPSAKGRIDTAFQQFAKSGLRVLAVAKKHIPKFTPSHSLKSYEEDLEFLGLVAIADTLRPEVPQAISKAKAAGITTIMITGDSELTAKKIAEEATLLSPGDKIITGAQLDSLTDEELDSQINDIKVFARTTPEHKLRIVRSLQRLGHVVAVTGDGINDSLALKQAHIGVAMGKIGTDVAKEASDLIILDDNYATIVTAIEQGRVIYNNILKVTKFLLAGNLSEVVVVLSAAFLALPSPFLPIQLLWINFVTDGLPAISLSADLPSKHVMSSPPRQYNQSLLNSSSIKFILTSAGAIAAVSLLSFIFSLSSFGLDTARTVVFTTLVVSQMVLVIVMRKHHSIWSNKYLLLSVSFVLICQLLIVTLPPLKALFKLS